MESNFYKNIRMTDIQLPLSFCGCQNFQKWHCYVIGGAILKRGRSNRPLYVRQEAILSFISVGRMDKSEMSHESYCYFIEITFYPETSCLTSFIKHFICFCKVEGFNIAEVFC